jgi:RimK family alpha-L-glutamate ligase
MRLGVLGAIDSWYVRDLQRASQGRHDVLPLPFARLQAAVAAGPDPAPASAGGHSLEAFDALLVRAMAPGSLEQVVFRMDLLARCQAAGVTVVNSPRAVETAVDKYLALWRLQQAQLPVPTTLVCQTAEDALEAFERLGRDVVLKPLFGAEGRGITRLTDDALAVRAFRMLEQFDAVLYLQQFIPHGDCDYRLFVVGDEVLGMKRVNPDDWRTNVSRGAVGQPLRVTPKLADLARRSAAAVDASLAGVDVVPAEDGRLLVIEVNAAPGWQALSNALDIDVAALVLQHLECRVRADGRQREG